MATWFIDPEKNEGYPMLNVWPPEWQTDYTSSDTIRYPDYMWRIEAGINEDYPWIYPWFKKSSSDGGEMEHGGSQTNYPNGFSYSDNGGIDDQFNDDNMDDNTGLVTVVNSTLLSAMAAKIFAITTANMTQIRNCLNSTSIIDAANRAVIQSIYGANVYDGIAVCRAYPFTIQRLSDLKVSARIFGLVPLYPTDASSEDEIPDSEKFYATPLPLQHFHMGNITPDVRQAYEVEGVEYSIYLPFAGVHPIQITDGSDLNLQLYIDILTGSGEYILKQNGQVTNSWSCMFGYDLPLNFVNGELTSNMLSKVDNVISFVGQGVATGAAAVGGPAGMAVGMGVQATANAAESLLKTPNVAINAPQAGGLTSVYSYPRARLIARIPKMFNGGYGYHQTKGQNRSTTYVQLNTCSGFTKCENYKCDVIVATTDEKNEIENLMNAGVFL